MARACRCRLFRRLDRQRADAGGRYAVEHPHDSCRHPGDGGVPAAAAAGPARNTVARDPDPGHFDDQLGAVRPHGPGVGAGRARQGIRAGGAPDPGQPVAHHADAHPAQHADARHGDRHAEPVAGHPDRGDAELPGRGHAAHRAVAGHAHPPG
ncbi:hypothetical protein G6F68_015525 [Rhizopus microsporus]|nr:hypothetical protein G6F68_015525 [Rhizopus microsporus]